MQMPYMTSMVPPMQPVQMMPAGPEVVPQMAPMQMPTSTSIQMMPVFVTRTEMVPLDVPVIYRDRVMEVEKRGEKEPVEKIVEVEKVVEVEKIVEKVVEVEKIVEKVVEVEKIVEKIVEVPHHEPSGSRTPTFAATSAAGTDFTFLQDGVNPERKPMTFQQTLEHEAMRQALKHSTVVFAGNPGTGKSTMLNSLVQPEEPQFKAGISFGAGLTRVCQEYTSERLNTTFVDTPGLNDIAYVEEAAKEISQMLQHNAKLGRSVKIGFFAQLNSGRVRPEDVTTMNAILDAINLPDVNDRFVLIINKLDPVEYRYLKDHTSEEFAKVVGCCFVKYRTNLVVTLPRESDLESMSTPYASHELMKDVVVRLLQAECLKLDAERLLQVDPHEWEKKVQAIKDEMGQMSAMLEEKEEELQSLIARQTKSDEERVALKHELDDQIERLSSATSTAMTAREEADSLTFQMQEMTQKITELSLERDEILHDRTDAEMLAAQIEQLTAQLEAVKEEKELLLSAQHTSQATAKRMEEIATQLEQLGAERDQLVETQSRQSDLAHKLDDVTAQLDALNHEKTANATHVHEMEEERARMQAQLEKAEKTVNSVKKAKKRALAVATFGLSLAFSGKSDKKDKPSAAAAAGKASASALPTADAKAGKSVQG